MNHPKNALPCSAKAQTSISEDKSTDEREVNKEPWSDEEQAILPLVNAFLSDELRDVDALLATIQQKKYQRTERFIKTVEEHPNLDKNAQFALMIDMIFHEYLPDAQQRYDSVAKLAEYSPTPEAIWEVHQQSEHEELSDFIEEISKEISAYLRHTGKIDQLHSEQAAERTPATSFLEWLTQGKKIVIDSLEGRLGVVLSRSGNKPKKTASTPQQ